MMERSTHLARVTSEIYERKYERFQCRRDVRILTIGNGLSGMSQRRATMIDISIGGAGLEVATITGLPEHYYLTIEGFPNRIGCAEAFRDRNRIGVKFIAPIDEELIHRIIRSNYFNNARN
jgi:hypothetical protein